MKTRFRYSAISFIWFFTLFLIISFTYNIYAQEAIFPRPFAIAIDDLGWNEGSSLGNEGGPWRLGVQRKMGVKDYEPIVEIGKTLGIRLQGLFILSEMDRLNTCAKYPTTTKQGANFDNSHNISNEQFDVMNYVIKNAAYLEFGLHGVGHEHFDNGVRTRAEWYDIQNNKPWPEQDIRDHLKAFSEIMAQYGLTKENGHSFPESFVPCAYGYYWNPNGDYSTGKLMNEYGVKYVNTLFNEIPECNPPVEFGGGFDHGVLVINRENYGNEWYKLAALPTAPLEEYKTDIIETHWPNWLAQDYFLQSELNKQWINYYKNIQRSKTHYLAKNTEQFYSQWLYKKYANVDISKGKILIDNRNMPQIVYDEDLLGNLVIKIALDYNQHVSKAEINGKPISAYNEDEGFGFIYLNKLGKDTYELTYEIGEKTMPIYINNTGTYNIYDVAITKNSLDFKIKMYGTQTVKIKCPEPKSIKSDNPNLKIISSNYDKKDELLFLELYGRNIQGEVGNILINF
ncbi:MAG: hypothetical protein ACUVRG_03790 [Ignavibacterium sp.]|uniref:hypothetical protein n=1 Tax=Ignavibacterium sp. TaxID=2651167 RepID=UPI00404A358F